MSSIFLLGSERSGSNLLRTLLGNHSQISAPVAPHFCDVFYKQFHKYRPLTELRKVELLQDLKSYVNHRFNDWKLIAEPKDLIDKYRLESFIDFVNALYQEKALQEGKRIFFSKDNHNHKYALGILKDIPEAKFVYLYRDPRDQVASWLRSPIHLHTPYRAVRKWSAEQDACLTLKYFYGLSMHFVKYESLVDSPEHTMKELLNFLNLPLESSCYQTNNKNTEAEKHPLWSNINKPIKKDNYGKYGDVLGGTKLNIVETVATQEMKLLGYEPVTSQDWEIGNPYLFRLQELWVTKKSIRKHRAFREKDMKILNEKKEFTKSLFLKFNK